MNTVTQMRPEEVAQRTASYLPNRVQDMLDRHSRHDRAVAPPTERELALHDEEGIEALLPPLPVPVVDSPLPVFDPQQLARDADTATDLWQAEVDQAAVAEADRIKAAEPPPTVSTDVFLRDVLTPQPLPPSSSAAALEAAQAPPRPLSTLDTPPPPSNTAWPGLVPALQGLWHDLHHFDQLPASSTREKMHMVFIRNGRGNMLLTFLLILLVLGTLVYFWLP